MRNGTWELSPFGIEVKKKLVEKQWSTKELAKKIGVNESFLSGLLYGQRKGYEYVEPIKKLLDIS